MTALLTKEFRQSWRSFRLPGILLVLLFLAILDPLVSRYMGEIFARFVEGVTFVLPPPSSAQAMGQFLGDIAELGILVIIGTTMGAVSTEKSSGATSFIVTRPVSRFSYVAAKFLVLLGGLTAGLAATTLIAALYTTTLIGPVDIARALPAALSTWLYAGFIFCLTFAASMTANGALSAGGLGFLAYLVTALAGAIFGKTIYGSYLPTSLVSNIGIFLNGSADLDIVGRILRPTLMVAILSILCLYLGFRSFKRQALP